MRYETNGEKNPGASKPIGSVVGSNNAAVTPDLKTAEVSNPVWSKPGKIPEVFKRESRQHRWPSPVLKSEP
jgi:hypothetical protein